MLQTRKNRVIFVTPTTSYEVHLTREQALSGLEIEEPIVADVVRKHEEFVAAAIHQWPSTARLNQHHRAAAAAAAHAAAGNGQQMQVECRVTMPHFCRVLNPGLGRKF